MVCHRQTFLNVHSGSQFAGRAHDDADFAPVHQIEGVLPLLVRLEIVDDRDFVLRDPGRDQLASDFPEHVEPDDAVLGQLMQIAENDLRTFDRLVMMILFQDFSTHRERYYSAIKNEILLFVTTQMDLEDIMLSEINQTEKEKHDMISLI